MVVDSINTFLLIVSLLLMFVVVKQMIYLFRYSVAEVGSHKMLYFGVGLISLSSMLCGFYSLRMLAQEIGSSLYIFSFSLVLLLVCCLTVVSKIVSELISQSNDKRAADGVSVIDPLTGIYNRYYIECRLDTEVARYKRYSTPLVVLVVNVSNFNHYNTVYGFQGGDRLLCSMALVMQSVIRDTDVVARYDADRFVIVLTDTPESSVSTIVDRLHGRLNDHISKNLDITDAYAMPNVKFGKAWCDISTRTGAELIEFALDQIQAEKTLLNKQDTLSLVHGTKVEKSLNEAA